MFCNSVFESIERGNVTFIEADASYCSNNISYYWFNSTDLMPIRQLERKKQLNSECPYFPGHGNCTCSPEILSYGIDGARPYYVASVNCSNLGITSLPKTLPVRTFSLDISNNKVNFFHVLLFFELLLIPLTFLGVIIYIFI